MPRAKRPDLGGRDLTPRQRKIVRVIRDSTRRNGYPPTLQEIGDAAGCASTSSVLSELSVLEEKRYLGRSAGRRRAVGFTVSGRV